MPIFIKPPGFRDPIKDRCPASKSDARSSATGDGVCSDKASSVYTSPDQPGQPALQMNAESALPDQPTETKETQPVLIGNAEYSSFLTDLPGSSPERTADSGGGLPDLQQTALEIPPLPNVATADISPFEDLNAGYSSTIAQTLPGDNLLASPVTSENTAALDLQTNAQPPGSIFQASSGDFSVFRSANVAFSPLIQQANTQSTSDNMQISNGAITPDGVTT
ncbi:hypothetical protein MMC29_005100 [Sticta canariensis]|nr:hypothetical protein [Sticta canariensis]